MFERRRQVNLHNNLQQQRGADHLRLQLQQSLVSMVVWRIVGQFLQLFLARVVSLDTLTQNTILYHTLLRASPDWGNILLRSSSLAWPSSVVVIYQSSINGCLVTSLSSLNPSAVQPINGSMIIQVEILTLPSQKQQK